MSEPTLDTLQEQVTRLSGTVEYISQTLTNLSKIKDTLIAEVEARLAPVEHIAHALNGLILQNPGYGMTEPSPSEPIVSSEDIPAPAPVGPFEGNNDHE